LNDFEINPLMRTDEYTGNAQCCLHSSQHDWCWEHVGIVLYVLEWSSCAGKDFCPVTVTSILMHQRILLRVCLNSIIFHSKSKLLCRDLMKDRHDSNTQITDITIGLISVIRFDFIHI